ncbi:MAG: thiamine diphosphokinase, partial [Bifidobacteriaceae bacterium]|nr:thiamine diphosphokinase [Bifidobacteriaceae bacterium]
MTDFARSTCSLIAAGVLYPLPPQHTPDPNSLIIAADGGYNHTQQLHVTPNILVGDFDSITTDLRDIPDSVQVIDMPAEKDDTDLSASVKIAWNQGIRVFHIYAAMGNRIDHTLSNIQQLAYIAQSGGIAFMYGEDTILCAIHNNSLTFSPTAMPVGSIFSILSHSDISRGVTIRNLKYVLENGELDNISKMGSCNEFISKETTISVEEGTLLIMFPLHSELPKFTLPIEQAHSLGEISHT